MAAVPPSIPDGARARRPGALSWFRLGGGDTRLTMNEPAPVSGLTGKTPSPLKAAIRQARIEAAERSAVVVDLRDAELARLEMLSEALEPVFAEIPADIDLFDRGITHGEPPRLWIDMVAHVVMARDRRVYRFVQDMRYGRRVLAETAHVPQMVAAVTQYVARRLVERERALAGGDGETREARALASLRRHRRRRGFLLFAAGLLCGAAALLAAAWFLAPRLY